MATNIIKVKVDDESRKKLEQWTQAMEQLTSELRNFARAIVAASIAFQELGDAADKAGNGLESQAADSHAAVAEAVAAEREACAAVADRFAQQLMSAPIMTTESAKMAMAEEIAAAIRARGEGPLMSEETGAWIFDEVPSDSFTKVVFWAPFPPNISRPPINETVGLFRLGCFDCGCWYLAGDGEITTPEEHIYCWLNLPEIPGIRNNIDE